MYLKASNFVLGLEVRLRQKIDIASIVQVTSQTASREASQEKGGSSILELTVEVERQQK